MRHSARRLVIGTLAAVLALFLGGREGAGEESVPSRADGRPAGSARVESRRARCEGTCRSWPRTCWRAVTRRRGALIWLPSTSPRSSVGRASNRWATTAIFRRRTGRWSSLTRGRSFSNSRAAARPSRWVPTRSAMRRPFKLALEKTAIFKLDGKDVKAVGCTSDRASRREGGGHRRDTGAHGQTWLAQSGGYHTVSHDPAGCEPGWAWGVSSIMRVPADAAPIFPGPARSSFTTRRR